MTGCRSASAVGIGLVDVCMAVATVGVLTGAVLAAVPRWTGGADEVADRTGLELLLRDVQQQAVGDGRTLCVEAATRAVLPGECAADRAGVTFFADGSATSGTFRAGPDIVTLDGSGQIRRARSVP